MAGLITRFAPSPTGPLHLGHAFSALTAAHLAETAQGQMLLRIEDIDTARCKPLFEQQIYDDLHWLGLDWPVPVMRQSDRRPAYRAALSRLAALGVTYRCTCTRGDIRAALSAPQEGAPRIGPDGPVYPGTCREAGHQDPGAAIRLNMDRAVALGCREVYVLQVGRVEQALPVPRRLHQAPLVAFEIARRHRFATFLAGLPDDVTVHVLPSGHTLAMDDRRQLAWRKVDDATAMIDGAADASRRYLDDTLGPARGDLEAG